MSRNNGLGLGYTMGIGLVGAMAGMYFYSMSKPKYQREIQRSFRKATNELNDLVSDLGESLHELTMER